MPEDKLTEEDKFNLLLDAKHTNKRLESMESALNRIEAALVGNPALGHRGLVERVDSLETKVATHERKFLTWGGIVTGVAVVFHLIMAQVTAWLKQ